VAGNRVIAEWVENEGIVRALRQLRVYYGQG
jgi:EAL domain-containing protein (putative c-di-GMP-specific phosphodiesterase class I)